MFTQLHWILLGTPVLIYLKCHNHCLSSFGCHLVQLTKFSFPVVQLLLSVKTLHKKVVCTAHNTSIYFGWVSTTTGCVRKVLGRYVKIRNGFRFRRVDKIRSWRRQRRGGSMGRASGIDLGGMSTNAFIITGSGVLWKLDTSMMEKSFRITTTNKTFVRWVAYNGLLMFQTKREKTRKRIDAGIYRWTSNFAELSSVLLRPRHENVHMSTCSKCFLNFRVNKISELNVYWHLEFGTVGQSMTEIQILIKLKFGRSKIDVRDQVHQKLHSDIQFWTRYGLQRPQICLRTSASIYRNTDVVSAYKIWIVINRYHSEHQSRTEGQNSWFSSPHWCTKFVILKITASRHSKIDPLRYNSKKKIDENGSRPCALFSGRKPNVNFRRISI